MTFWKHSLVGLLIFWAAVLLLFFVSAFTPWDLFSPIQDNWLIIVPALGLAWTAAYFLRKPRGNSN